MSNVFTVALGGALGAVCRYLITLLPMNPESGFPVKTFLINVAGSFLIGVVAALAARNALNPRTVLFLKVGICGGFTTFSLRKWWGKHRKAAKSGTSPATTAR